MSIDLCRLLLLVTVVSFVNTESSSSNPVTPSPFDLRLTARFTSADLKSLLIEELGLHKMQFILDMLAAKSEAVVKEKRISFLSRKISEKMDEYAKLIASADALETQLKHDLSSFLNESESSEQEFGLSLDAPSFVYHRLDILSSPPKLCKYFKQLATLDVSTLFLSGTAYEKPHEALSSIETDATTQQLMRYLNDCGNKVGNPGVRPRIRQDVAGISRITKMWKERSKTGVLSKYVVRRYVATESGAFLVYPGSAIDRSYEATRRDWYRTAVQHPARVIFTAPYLDVGGAGYIVTLSHAIHEGSYSKGEKETLLGVMGMDFTLGYFHKLLMQSIDVCRQDNITCFLMDDKGYLLAHASLIEPSGRGPVEYTHITHKEPLVANDLLNHKFFMKKKVCSSHADCTVQRHYSLNMSLHSVLTNLVHGEHCSKYQITAIPESNIFIGIVNKTCDTMTAFCPCSVVDRLCLNCHRMEQTDCECPCECPLETCPSTYTEDDLTQDSTCSPAYLSQELQLPALELRSDEDVPSCFQVDCSTRRAESDCQGVLGCEWCQLDISGQPLKHKFCNFQRQCFGGVLGVRTPYADEFSETMISEVPFSRVTPFTSIIFVLVTCVILLSFVVYCYRFHVHRAACALYVQNVRDGNVRMSQLDEVDEARDETSVQKPISNAGALLANIEAAAVVSPYRLNPGYRRPACGGDSDNGYSTMTAHEDSEHLGPAFDPLLLGKGVPASLTSISTTSRTSSSAASCSGTNSMPLTTTAKTATPFETSFNTQAQVHQLLDCQ